MRRLEAIRDWIEDELPAVTFAVVATTLTIVLALAPLALVDWFTAREAAAQTGRTILDHPNRFAANVGDIGATLTEILAAPASGSAHYVTMIVLVSSTSTAGSFALRQGTGTNCGTSTLGVFPQPGVASPTLTYVYPANTAVPLQVSLVPPIRLVTGNALCLIGAATNLARGSIQGFTAP